MASWRKLIFWRKEPPLQVHLARGKIGENAARDYLFAKGLKFLTANYLGRRGEIDLIFRDGNCLVFVEVKTRTGEGMTRPGEAVDRKKKQSIARTAREYIRQLDDSRVPFRFDIVEVILESDQVREIRHIEQTFTTERLWRWKR